MISSASSDLRELRDFIYEHLTGNIIPFWLRHAIDPDGGINTCINDDGTLINRDKWLWSQWRSVWVYSKLYNAIDKKQEWLDTARNIEAFTEKYGWDKEVGGWVLGVSHDGKILNGCESIYTDAFAIYGLNELAIASGDSRYSDLACKTAERAMDRLKSPHDQIPHFPYPIPKGARVHGIPMIYCLSFWELGRNLGEPRYLDVAKEMVEDIFTHFYRPDRDLILERIGEDNSEFPPPEGTAVVPGHVIEDMWFQIHIARDRVADGGADSGTEKKRIEECCRLTKRHMEVGWDDEYGGLFLAIDADGGDKVGWNFADAKIWWPQTEALYTLLLAYEHSRDDWCLEWYDKVHEYSYSHYPVKEHGEWVRNLTREGEPFYQQVALPVKDPFHLQRALILCVECLDRLLGK